MLAGEAGSCLGEGGGVGEEGATTLRATTGFDRFGRVPGEADPAGAASEVVRGSWEIS